MKIIMWYRFVMYSYHSSRTLANNEKDIEVFKERLKLSLKGRQHEIHQWRQHEIHQCDILCSIFIWNTDGRSVFHRKQRSRRRRKGLLTAPDFHGPRILCSMFLIVSLRKRIISKKKQGLIIIQAWYIPYLPRNLNCADCHLNPQALHWTAVGRATQF
jgi:hypothetical protein